MQKCEKCGVGAYERHKRLNRGWYGINRSPLLFTNGPLENKLLDGQQLNGEMLRADLDEIAWWNSIRTIFDHAGLRTVKQLVRYRGDDFYNFPGVGPVNLHNIQQQLAELGLCLGMKV